MSAFLYPYMVLVVALNNRISKEIIIRCQVLPLTSSPIHILLFPTKAVIVVSQAQYELDPISPCLSYNKIQALQTIKKTKIINIVLSLKIEKKKDKMEKIKCERDLKHLLIVGARRVLQGSVTTITECPSSSHI